MRKNILLVEDEENFGSLLSNYLELSGYSVTWRTNGSTGYSAFAQGDFDLCVLDVMLPYMDGFQLAKKIKEKSMNTPVIFLTAKNSKEDLIKGYGVGADDYLTKPFDTDVLLLKINVILGRLDTQIKHVEELEEYEIGAYLFRPANRNLVYNKKDDVKLSPKEALLLELLCQYKVTIMPRELALKKIWKENNYFTKRSMDVFIAKLRKRLALDSSVSIDTYHQMGFQLRTSN